MITREMQDELVASCAEYPVVTVLGPRQSGKTTLVRMAFPGMAYRNLEEPDLRLLAQEDPRGLLGNLPDGGILDEVQRVPELLSYVQAIVDRDSFEGKFILTGSHQPEVHQAISQSLAGRTAVLQLLPLSLKELQQHEKEWAPFELVSAGMFPRLHEHQLDPRRFFNSYIQTYVERDVRALVRLKDMRRFQSFLMLLAGRVGQLLNYSSLANDVGVSSTTIKDWISVLAASFVVFEIAPYAENISKRVVKTPKVYFADAGLAAHLIGIRTAEHAARDPLRGSLFENLIVAEFLKARLNRNMRPELYFYRDRHGNEVDLVVRDGRTLVPIEIKSASTFTAEFQKGIAHFQEVVGRGALVSPGAVLYAGEHQFEYRGARVLNPFIHDGIAELACFQ